MRAFLGIAAFAAVLVSAGAAVADCNQPMPEAVSQVALPGHPFSAIPTADGCTIFVSLTARPSKLVVLKRDNGVVTVGEPLDVDGLLTGLALSPDGRFLAAANGTGVLLFDVAALGGGATPLVTLSDGDHAGTIYPIFSPNGHLLVAANERSQSLSVYDVSTLPAAPGFLGKLQTGGAPVGLAFSPDGALLYSTSENGPPTWVATCKSEGHPHSQGILLVFDFAKVTANAKPAMLAGVEAGCNAVRVALSPDGGTAYVTARGDNAVAIFNTAALLHGPATVKAVKVGISPVGVAAAGGRVFVTNSDRFGGNANQSVSVLDADHPDMAVHSIPAGGFPRELKVTADGNTLLVTNFTSGSLELVDLKRLDQAAK